MKTTAQMKRWNAAMVGCLLILSACKPELEVEPRSPEERVPNPAFVIRDPRTPDTQARFNTVQLLDDDASVLWHARAQTFGIQNGGVEVSYGIAPEGFETVVPPAALEPNKRYHIVVIGQGHGQFAFHVDAAGIIRAE